MRSAVSAMLVMRIVVVATPINAATPSACMNTGSRRSIMASEGPNGSGETVAIAEPFVSANVRVGVVIVPSAGGGARVVTRTPEGSDGGDTTCTGMKAIQTHESSISSRPSR